VPCRCLLQHSGSGLPLCADRFRDFILQFIAANDARFPPLHRLSVSSNSCYFVIVALSTADESNATLKTVTGSVNNAGLDRRVQFVIPFPKADYHRNR
jgi:hypothetical protein